MSQTIKKVTFKNPRLLSTALTHKSSLNENKSIKQSNERLEFLGDAVLELIVSSFLYKKFPKLEEGELTHLRAKIVQTKTLARVGKNLKLGEKLIMSKGEKIAKGSQKDSLLANTFEAIIGAIYLDQGLNTTRAFIHQNLLNQLESIISNQDITDFKSQLQQLWQKQHHATPVYKLVNTKGPDHQKIFTVKVYLKSKAISSGNGKSKQEAQQHAAKLALEKNKPI